MFKTRLLSGIVLVLVALLTICSGGTVLYMTVLCLSLIGAGELFRAMKVREDKWNLLEITGYAGVVIFYLSLLLHDPMYQMLALILDLVLLMAVYVFTYPKYNANQVMPAFFGGVYVAVMLSFIYLTRNLCGCLCRRNAFLCISDPYAGRRKIPCMADFPVLLGLRYVCILCRRTLWKT